MKTQAVQMKTTLHVGNVEVGAGRIPAIIAGPCVIESEEHALRMAEGLIKITREYGFPYIFKTSFDKANRSSIHAYRGPGLRAGLEIIRKVKARFNIPVLTDIHDVRQIGPVSRVVDIIQIPAFLCRQTDLYIEAGKFDIPVNVKKGQFLSPDDVANILEKARHCGIREISVTERGTSFGYQRLIVDFVGLAQIREYGVPVIFDATHAVQLPGAGGTFTSGNRDYVPHLCRAAAAVGVDGLFMEVHDRPDSALCDGANMITPDTFIEVLRDVRRIVESLAEEVE